MLWGKLARSLPLHSAAVLYRDMICAYRLAFSQVSITLAFAQENFPFHKTVFTSSGPSLVSGAPTWIWAGSRWPSCFFSPVVFKLSSAGIRYWKIQWKYCVIGNTMFSYLQVCSLLSGQNFPWSNLLSWCIAGLVSDWDSSTFTSLERLGPSLFFFLEGFAICSLGPLARSCPMSHCLVRGCCSLIFMDTWLFKVNSCGTC